MKQGVSEIPHSDLHRLILRRSRDGLIAIDQAGELLLCNGAARRLLGDLPSSAPVDEWPARCGARQAYGGARVPASEFPLTRALGGEATIDQELFFAHGARGRGVRARASGTPLREGGQVHAGLMILRVAEAPLRQGSSRPVDFLSLAKRVAAAAKEAAPASSVLQKSLDAICEATGWQVGHLYWRQEGEAGLVSSGVWHLDSSEGRAAFRGATERSRSSAGLDSPEPSWTADLTRAPHSARRQAALDAGLLAAFAVPIVASGQVVGVIELFSERPAEPDAQWGLAMGDVVSPLAAVLERDVGKRREEFLAAIIDRVAHPIFVKDREFRFVLLNQALCRMVGYPREQMLGKTDYDFFAKEEADFFRKKDQEMFQSGSTVVIDEERVTDSAGAQHVLATTKVPMRAASGEVTHLVGIVHDITRLKAAEEQARQFEREQVARAAAEAAQRRTALLASASRLLATSLARQGTLEVAARLPIPELADCCFVTLVDGPRLRVAAVGAHPGREGTAAELASSSSPEALHGAGAVIRTGQPELISELTAGELVELFGAHPAVAQAASAGLSYLCVPLPAHAQSAGAMTLLRLGRARPPYDQSDLFLAEQLGHRVAVALDNAQLYEKAQEAIRARDEFLSIASHELRTPLTTLKINASRLLGSGGALARREREIVLSMGRQVERLTLLISNLLDVSRVAAGRLELNVDDVDLGTLAREVLERSSAELERAGSQSRVRVKGVVVGRWDRLRLEQIVTNLLSNAIKYGEGRPIEVTVEPEGSGARLCIRDHGIGIAPEDLARIFARFERAAPSHKYGGLGLGLYISQRLARAHGGIIRVESRPGEGSTFTVDLPGSPP